jgi:hypothetical protein
MKAPSTVLMKHVVLAIFRRIGFCYVLAGVQHRSHWTLSGSLWCMSGRAVAIEFPIWKQTIEDFRGSRRNQVQMIGANRGFRHAISFRYHALGCRAAVANVRPRL